MDTEERLTFAGEVLASVADLGEIVDAVGRPNTCSQASASVRLVFPHCIPDHRCCSVFGVSDMRRSD
jgi:hypothetical protein